MGPFPEACGRAWTHIRQEAMENYELREGSRQEEWGKIGPLKDPTPANVKHRGATYRRVTKRDGEEQQVREEGREVQQRREAAPSRERPEEREENAWTKASEGEEMDGIRDAVAEAIHEAEEQASAEGPTQRESKDTTTMVEATTTSAQTARAETTTVGAPPMGSQERGEPRMGRTPLQRLHGALMRRLVWE